jgi:hypothetical protein
VALILAPAGRGATGPADSPTEPTGTAAPTAGPSGPAVDPPPDRPGRRARGVDAWRSRVLATLAYLLTLAGLAVVAVTGTDAGAARVVPINRADGAAATADAISGIRAGIQAGIEVGLVAAEAVNGPSAP